MKKALVLVALAALLVACSSKAKDAQLLPKAPKDTYFSHVQRFKDGRQPATDTLWTIHVISPEMLAAYQPQDGMIYADSHTYTEVGVLWYK